MSNINEKNNFNKTAYIFLAGFAILLLAYFLFQSKPQVDNLNLQTGIGNEKQGNQPNRNNCLADDCLTVQGLDYPVGKLPNEVKTALDEAINDEYKALSTYEKTIGTFGQVRPFSMIKGAEEQHIASLKAIYDKYGLAVPENQWTDKIATPATLKQACQTGVDAEIANVALYKNKLLPAVTNYEDITLVFTNLMNASQQKHLPAFDKCN
jgi:hypothetical protein